MDLQWTVYNCMIPVAIQGAQVSLPLIGVSMLLRLCVAWSGFGSALINILSTLLGLGTLWMFYGTGVGYFITLCVLAFMTLQLATKHKGAIAAIVCVAFLLIW